jgi:hypothetical protein
MSLAAATEELRKAEEELNIARSEEGAQLRKLKKQTEEVKGAQRRYEESLRETVKEMSFADLGRQLKKDLIEPFSSFLNSVPKPLKTISMMLMKPFVGSAKSKSGSAMPTAGPSATSTTETIGGALKANVAGQLVERAGDIERGPLKGIAKFLGGTETDVLKDIRGVLIDTYRLHMDTWQTTEDIHAEALQENSDRDDTNENIQELVRQSEGPDSSTLAETEIEKDTPGAVVSGDKKDEPGGIFGKLKATFKKIVNAIQGYLKWIMKGGIFLVLPVIVAFFNSDLWTTLKTTITEKLIPGLGKMWETLKPIATAIWNWTAETGLPIVISAITAGIGMMTELFNDINAALTGEGSWISVLTENIAAIGLISLLLFPSATFKLLTAAVKGMMWALKAIQWRALWPMTKELAAKGFELLVSAARGLKVAMLAIQTTVLTPMISALATGGKAGLATLVKAAQALKAALLAIQTTVLAPMVAALAPALVAAAPFVAIAAAVALAVKSLYDAFMDAKAVFDETGDIWAAISEGLSSFLATFLGFIPNIIKSIVAWAAEKLGFKGVAEWLRSFDIIDGLKNIFRTMFDGVFSFLGKLFTNPVELASSIWDAISAGFSKIGEWVGSIFDIDWKALLSKFLPEKLVNWLTKDTEALDAATESGLYDKDLVGDSEINRDMVGDASTRQLKAILDDDDLSDKDKEFIKAALDKRDLAELEKAKSMSLPAKLGDTSVDMDTIEGRREFLDKATEDEWQTMFKAMQDQGVAYAGGGSGNLANNRDLNLLSLAKDEKGRLERQAELEAIAANEEMTQKEAQIFTRDKNATADDARKLAAQVLQDNAAYYEENPLEKRVIEADRKSKIETMDYMFGINMDALRSSNFEADGDQISDSFLSNSTTRNSIGDVSQFTSSQLTTDGTGADMNTLSDQYKKVKWEDWQGDEEKLRSLGIYSAEELKRMTDITGSAYMGVGGGRGDKAYQQLLSGTPTTADAAGALYNSGPQGGGDTSLVDASTSNVSTATSSNTNYTIVNKAPARAYDPHTTAQHRRFRGMRGGGS